jgi:hypothetical protein
MGENSPVDLFYLLWHLPLFSSIHEPARYFGFPMVFCFSLVCGGLLNSSLFTRGKRPVKTLIVLIYLYALLNVFTTNSLYNNFTGKMKIPPPPDKWEENVFFNVRTVPGSSALIPHPEENKFWKRSYAPELALGMQYFLIRQNIGLINWFGNITLEENAREKYRVTLGYGNYWENINKDPSRENGVLHNTAYKGESYFLDGTQDNKVSDIKLEPDSLKIKIDQSLPDTLIINQNYGKNWHTDRGRLININGLMGIMLDNPFKGVVSLRYVPSSLFPGLAISIISFLFCLFILFRKRPR